MKLDYELYDDEDAPLLSIVAGSSEAVSISQAAEEPDLTNARNHLRNAGLAVREVAGGLVAHRLAQDGASGPLGHFGAALGRIYREVTSERKAVAE